MIHFLDESGRQNLRNLLADGSTLLVEAAQSLLHRLGVWPDLQGMLGDFPWNAWHVQGFPRKDVSIDTEEVNERAFLFGEKRDADLEHLAIRVARVHGDLLEAFSRLKGPSRSLESEGSSMVLSRMATSSVEATIAAA